MRVDKLIRDEMLVTLNDIIVAGFAAGKGQVDFLGIAGGVLCSLEFDEIDPIATGGDKSIIRLQSIDGSYVLKGTVDGVADQVDSFRIWCDVDGSTDYYITGNVGTLTSSAEIRFNIVDWTDGTFISIENFDIVIPNGV